MANTNDYQLEDAEDAAVQKSKNLKRGLAIGAGVLGAGTATAFGANEVISHMNEQPVEDLTADDILAGAQAGADGATEELKEVQQPAHTTQSNSTPEPEPEFVVEQTDVLYDEDGYYAGSVDSGTYDGKSFMVVDFDGNGRADVMAYDENNNGIYESNEFHNLDNDSYIMGKGKMIAGYKTDEWGDVEKIYEQPNIGPHIAEVSPRHHELNGVDDIHNDFEDEKTGEIYSHDLAENNRDYIKDDARNYSAGLEDDMRNDFDADATDFDASIAEADGTVDYDYTEPGTDDYTAMNDSYDDVSSYDA